jgi:site-specific recombinase XerD
VTLAVVRSIGTARRLRSPQELEDFEQELVDQYALAMAAAGLTDQHIAGDRAVIFEFVRFLGRPVWTTGPEDADRYLVYLRKERGQAKSTVQGKAGALAQFFDFLIVRYQGDIHALTGSVLGQPIDGYNRPAKADYGHPRVPPSEDEVEHLFGRWRTALPEQRKYLTAARNYMAASLWRRAGLRIGETVMLDIRDWRPDLGPLGKLHVRFGKGSRGRGPKTRLVPGINQVDAPLLPSERRDPRSSRCARVGDNALREGLKDAVGQWLPAWRGRLTPHGLRHFCASSLYVSGVDLRAIEDVLGHDWLATTSVYIHVQDDHIERSWAAANERITARLAKGTR